MKGKPFKVKSQDEEDPEYVCMFLEAFLRQQLLTKCSGFVISQQDFICAFGLVFQYLIGGGWTSG